MSEYYKSLISDDEVIQELIRESKRREGTLKTESSRLKPNMNFFQRTVNHLISNNKRINQSVSSFKEDYSKSKHRKTHTKRSSDVPKSKRLPVDHAYEKQLALEKKINFLKALNEEKEHKTKKPYQSSSIRKSNESLLKYIEELSTDSSDSESLPGQYFNKRKTEYIDKKSTKSKNIPAKHAKKDKKDTNNASPTNITCQNIPKTCLNSESQSNDDTIICISSDDSVEEIPVKSHKKKKKRNK